MKMRANDGASKLTILDAINDPKLFGSQFEGDSWGAWRAFLAALFGLGLEGEALDTFRQHTGRQEPPTAAAREAYAIVGRRGGKSRIASLLAVFLSCFRDYSAVLAPGEWGTVMCLSADRKQARNIFRYTRGLLEGVPMLRSLISRSTRETIELRNRIAIEIHTNTYRSVRGYTVVAAILDELAFWDDPDSANPDIEVIRALRPGMATVPGSLLLGVSTPYARRGALWTAYDRHYGADSPVLVWKASTLAMHPSIDPRVIEVAYEEDPAGAEAEYGAEFRRDVQDFLSNEAIEAVVVPGRYELPHVEGVTYVGFTDPSGGSRDAYTLAIAHQEGERRVLDLVRETEPPFSPEAVTEVYAGILRAYGLEAVTGDRYAGEWPRERFPKHGITYQPSEKSKSELYLELLPAVNSGQVELLDHKRLKAQLEKLERRTSRGGKDSVEHPPKGKDDLANAAAGALAALGAERPRWEMFIVGGDPAPERWGGVYFPPGLY